MNSSELPGIWFPQIYEATKNHERLEEIEVLSALGRAEFIEQYGRRSRPFILRDHRTIYGEAEAIQILLTSLGEQMVNVRFGDMSEPGAYINRRTEDMRLRDFLERHFLRTELGDDTAYAGNCVVTASFARTLKIDFPAFYSPDFFVEPRLWLGLAGTATALHKDIPDNFAHNYFGSKQWIIYPPRDFPHLHMVNPNSATYPDFGISQINVRHPDLKSYPTFAEARPIEFSLLPGDVFYLPAGWSHYVENVTNSLMMNFWLKREKSPSVLGCDI